MSDFVVTEKAMRPASALRRCFYCLEPVGGKHKYDCVLVSKTVKVRATVEYEIRVPHVWSGHNVEFSRNEGSACADRFIEELEALSGSEKANGCLCGLVKWEYLSDTSEAYLEEG